MKGIDTSIILLILNAGEKLRKVSKMVFNKIYKYFEAINPKGRIPTSLSVGIYKKIFYRMYKLNIFLLTKD